MVKEVPITPERFPQRVSIHATTLARTERPSRASEVGGQPYTMEASLLVPQSAQATIFFVHGASAPTSERPVVGYSYFQEQMAQRQIATLVYDSRSIGVERNNYDFQAKSFKASEGQFYKGTTLNDRIEDSVNALLWLTAQPNVPQKIILGGISMGGHVAVRLIDRLREIQTSDPHEQTRLLAGKALEKIKGILLVAPAAYTEDLPPRSPQVTPLEKTRYHKWHSTPAVQVAHESPVFTTLDAPYTEHLPIFLTYGIKDTVIPREIIARYREEVIMHDRTREGRYSHLSIWFGHGGLISPIQQENYPEFAKVSYQLTVEDQQELFTRMEKFVKEVATV